MKFLSSGLIAAISLFSHAFAESTNKCSSEIEWRLVYFFQTGEASLPYMPCHKDNSGNGYSSGIVNFSTRNGDALQVIKQYKESFIYAGEFDKYLDTLQKYADNYDGSTEGLEGYCDVWETASVDPPFWQAQRDIEDKMYGKPASDQAKKLGIQLPVVKAAIHDTAIARGPKGGSTTLEGIISATNKKFSKDTDGPSGETISISGYKVDEIAWLEEFLAVREAIGSSNDKTSIKTFRYLIKEKEFYFTGNIKAYDWNNKLTTIRCPYENP
ncbi:hypothetical protein EV183_001895 [Coemansia sp. RSA 2336]|nr:hypothetical protein EV183_001895 [Coemansia sp. RSA 2336]